jgi:hypothetical protein
MKTLRYFTLSLSICFLLPLAVRAQNLNGEWLNGDQTVTIHQNGGQVWFDYRGGQGHENLVGRVTGNFDGRTIRGAFTNREGSVSGSGNVYFNLTGDRLVGRWEAGGHSGDWTLVRRGNPGPSVGEDFKAQFVWNRDTDGNFVINIDGRKNPPEPAHLTGNFQNWQFTGHDPHTGADVSCAGGLDPGRKAAPDAPGSMKCEARLGQTIWRCQGPARMDVDWSVVAGGFAWFAIGPGNCAGTITEGGKTRQNKFGVVWVRSGLGLPLK